MNKEICPICDGYGYNFIESSERKILCWACKGEGKIVYKEEIHISENEIKTMLSALGQR